MDRVEYQNLSHHPAQSWCSCQWDKMKCSGSWAWRIQYRQCQGRPLMSWTVPLLLNTGNAMEERCSFEYTLQKSQEIQNLSYTTPLDYTVERFQETRVLSYSDHFIQYRKLQTIEINSQHMLLNMFRSGIKVSQSTLLIFSKSSFYAIPCKKVQRKCHRRCSTKASLL